VSPPARAPGRELPLPVSPVRTLDRSETELATLLRGRPALVTLWATWCDACRKEMPELGYIDAWAKEHDAVVVAVAVGETVDAIASFTTKTTLPYLVVVDEEFRFADALGSKRVPATLVVDRSGTIVYLGGGVDDRSVGAFRRVVGAPAPAPRTATITTHTEQ
jgi:thiol-disulfide isomerase/thioredoxin